MKLMPTADFVKQLKEMHSQIEELKANMSDPAYRPAKRTSVGERLKADRKEEKRLKVNKQAKDRREKAALRADPNTVAKAKAPKEVKPKIFLTEEDKEKLKREKAAIRKLNNEKRLIALENRTPEQRAKEIFKARKRKKDREELKEKPKVKEFIPPDLSQKIPLKIGNMTVYALPGYDLDELKDKYLNRHKKDNQDNRLHNQSKNQAMRDFD